MHIYSIFDLDIESIESKTYDCGVFASGFESRARYFLQKTNRSTFNTKLVFGFNELKEHNSRRQNDYFYRKHVGIEPKIIDTKNADNIVTLIDRAIQSSQSVEKNKISILVDYSSMPRNWYAAILNWARYGNSDKEIEIDFVYSTGIYPKVYPTRVVSNIYCIPGCEGHPDPNASSVAVFGLGFDNLAPLSVFDYLEPDVIYTFLAHSDTRSRNATKAIKCNEEFLKYTHNKPLVFPVLAVEEVYRGISELISPYRSNFNIEIIPLGPKPHVLASVLVSMRFVNVSCIHVQGISQSPPDIKPEGSTSLTRVLLRKSSNK